MIGILRGEKILPTERLLGMRANAGADQQKHDYYHRVVNRYQNLLLKNYIKKHPIRWCWIYLRKKIQQYSA